MRLSHTLSAESGVKVTVTERSIPFTVVMSVRVGASRVAVEVLLRGGDMQVRRLASHRTVASVQQVRVSVCAKREVVMV